MMRTRFATFVMNSLLRGAVSTIRPGLMPMSYPDEHSVRALTTTRGSEDENAVRAVSALRSRTGEHQAFFRRRRCRGSPNVCTGVLSKPSARHRQGPSAAEL